MSTKAQQKESGSFTRGPWRFVESPDSSRICDAEGVCLAVAYDLRRDSDGTEEEANARLIAAAPKLYEAAMVGLVYLQAQDLSERGKTVAQGLIDALTLAAD